MRITVNANEYNASKRLVQLIIESIDEMTNSEPSLKATSFEDAAAAMVALQKKTTAIKEVSVSENAITFEIAEEFVVELFDVVYTPVTKKIIRLLLVTIDTLKGIIGDTKTIVENFTKKWTK